jgi:pyrimidine operon attenuation protein/uracil phosphoribosyltransferase
MLSYRIILSLQSLDNKSIAMKQRTLILDSIKAEQKLNRIAYEILENNFEETEIVLVGIMNRGAVIAERISGILKSISTTKITLLTITLPTDLYNGQVVLSDSISSIENKSVVVIDDVLNSGRTLIYATTYLLSVPTKKIHTAVLVDRMHRLYPIRADFAGTSLSTTLKEHIAVEISGATNDKIEVYLE